MRFIHQAAVSDRSYVAHAELATKKVYNSVMYISTFDPDNQSLLSIALDARAQLNSTLDNIEQIIGVNDTITELATTSLTNVKSQLNELGKGGGLSNKIDHIIKQMGDLLNNPTVLEGKEKMRERVLVLYISAFEAFLCDFIKSIGNNIPSLFEFDDKREKISFDQQLLKDGFILGDAIFEHIISKGISFQDLGATIRAWRCISPCVNWE